MNLGRTRRVLGSDCRIFLAFFALATFAQAAGPESWVPARWQGGPLEIDRRVRQKLPALDAKVAEVVSRWYEPATLDLLKDTPINCLLVTWATGGSPAVESRQRALLSGYANEARKRGISVLGVVYPGSNVESSVQAAREAELDGVVLEGEFPETGASTLPVFPLCSRPWLPPAGSRAPGTLTGTAPGERALSDGDGATATPTAEPWIDSNTWLVRAVRGRTTSRVWFGFALDRTSAGDYARAIADAAVAGGTWVVALDPVTMAALWWKQSEAVSTWRRISDYLKFNVVHREWQRFVPTGPLGIIYDADSKQADIQDEYLNLIARRRIPYRVIDRRALKSEAIAGLDAVLAVGLDPPTSEERTLLATFAEGGGLLVAGPSWKPPGAGRTGGPYTVLPSGKGRLAIYSDPAPDPEALSKDMVSLLGRGNLGIRLFNASSVLPYPTADASGRRLLIQLVNYASAPSEGVTARISGDYRTARLYSPDAPAAELALEKPGGYVQVRIPAIPVYSALLLEK